MITSLHSHTCFSDGFLEPHELAAVCDTIAITDHGTLAAHYYNDSRCKVIRGIELYVDLPPEMLGESNKTRKVCHLTVLADGEAGWRELVQLNKLAWQQFYYVPRLTLEQVQGDHIIVLSGCPSSPIAKLFLMGKLEEAERVYLELANRFRGRFYAEVQHGLEIQNSYSQFVIELAKRHGHTIVFTQDAHYSNSTYLAWRASRHGFDCPVLAIDREVPQEMLAYYHNSVSLARDIAPYSVPNMLGVTQTDDDINYLKTRISAVSSRLDDSDRERISYELDVMQSIGICGYMRLADEVFQTCKRVAGVAVVRGSAASSLVAHCLGWSQFHPDRFNLVFERFVSRHRRELPDVDIDVPASSRDAIIAELSKRFKLSKVATKICYAEAAAKNQVARAARDGKIPANADTATIASQLLGRMYGLGVHAAGLAVIPDEAEGILPMRYVDKHWVCEWCMDVLPVVKIDILGQKTLDVVHSVVNDSNRDLCCYTLDDKAVYNSMHSDTVGVFQLEGAMRSFARFCLKQEENPSVDTLSFISAMYRPAVIDAGLLEQYLRGTIKVPPRYAKVCRHGFPVYQEDLLRILGLYMDISHAYTIIKLLAKKQSNKVQKYLSDIGCELPPNLLTYIESYAGYAFNLAHSAAYAVRSYHTAYIRHYYPHLFWPIMIDAENDDMQKACYIMRAARQFDVLPPDGLSVSSRVEGSKLILGLCNVKRYSTKTSGVRQNDLDMFWWLGRLHRRDRNALESARLLDYWSGKHVDTAAGNAYCGIPLYLDCVQLRANRTTLATMIDYVLTEKYVNGKRYAKAEATIYVWSDGERITDGTDIVWCKAPLGLSSRCITITAAKDRFKTYAKAE